MTLLYFAWVRQKIGRNQEQFDLPVDVTTVGALAEHLRARGEGYADVFSDLTRIRVAVNLEHTGFDARVAADDEVAFFPPVTGG